MKISNFSKTVHTIFIKFCSHSTPKGAPACSKASKSYDWNVRNIAKIDPKMAKKQPFFDFFFDFRKNCPYDSNEIFYSHSTLYYGPLCAISLNSYGWDVRNIAKISPKMAKKSHFLIFSKTVRTIRTKFSTVILHFIMVLFCAFSLNSYGWDVRNIVKINQKWPKRNFSIFSKTVHTIRTKIYTVIFYTIVWSYVCNFNKFV